MSIRNLDALFEPRAIALIGASNKPGSVGAVLAENLFGAGFKGPVMAVNPHETAIRSALSYRSVAELPATPDLAVIATQAPAVPALIADLGQRGCRAAVVVTTGFGTATRQSELRQQMLDAAKPHLLRIVGPNCLGFISTPRGINASFAPQTPRPGKVALVSQSGGLVGALLDWADRRSIGFSQVISLGDMDDVDIGDVLDYLCGDANTRSVLLYVENLTRARKFMSAARALARTKPVIVVKAGRSAAGAKAALSHTGALAGTDLVYDAAFRRAGLLRVAELDDLFTAAEILAKGVRVSGDRLTILTNGGGAGILATDALGERGNRLATLSAEVIAKLDAVLPADWPRGNPVDIHSEANGERYAAALEALLEERESDAVLVINCPTAVADSFEAARAVVQVAKQRCHVPVLANWLGGTVAQRSRSLLTEAGLPSFTTPEEAVRAFSHLEAFRRNQELLLETPSAGVVFSPRDVEAARGLIKRARGEKRTTLTEPESKALLALFGIPTVETTVVATPEEAGAHFGKARSPVALKILSQDIIHKSDVGGVALGLKSRAEVEAAASEMLERVRRLRPQARIDGFAIQPMILRPKAHELILGIAQDATFGPVILFGRGGTATEVIGDRVVGLPPLNSVLARDMIARTRVSRLLAGFRNVPPVPLEPIVDILVRLSELVVQLPEIRELDINPLLVNAEGVIALDAHIVIGKARAGGLGLSITPYPHELERRIAFDEGATLRLRPIRPEDEGALAEMVALCTPEDLRKRFLGPLKVFPHEMAARFSQIDYDREMALVAVPEGAPYGAGPIYGVVRIYGDPERKAAEYAILVRSDMKGRGLGRRLMLEIVAHAREQGYQQLYGEVLAQNQPMLKLARELGFKTAPSADDPDIAHVELVLDRHKPTA